MITFTTNTPMEGNEMNTTTTKHKITVMEGDWMHDQEFFVGTNEAAIEEALVINVQYDANTYVTIEPENNIDEDPTYIVFQGCSICGTEVRQFLEERGL